VVSDVQTGSADDELLPDVNGLADSDHEDEADGEPLMDTHQPAQDVAFKIHPDIDINSKALKGIISTDPVFTVSIDISLDSVLSPRAATIIDYGDADWNY
jgi:hypothetical protein